jgi:hypothetical protein
VVWSRCLLVNYQLKHMKFLFLSFQPYFPQNTCVSQIVCFCVIHKIVGNLDCIMIVIVKIDQSCFQNSELLIKMLDLDIVSLVASTNARYFDFVKNNAIHVCLFVHQVIGMLLISKIYVLVYLCSFASSPQSASLKPKVLVN